MIKITKPLKALVERAVSLPTAVWGVIISVLAVGVILLNTVFNVGCLMKAVLGIPCPVCGMTRAYLSLLRLDFRAAFEYNPAFWIIPPMLAFGILSSADKKRTKPWIVCFFSLLALLTVIWIIRLALGAAV